MNPTQLDSLNDPDLFPAGRSDFRILQTHLSVVCLAGDFAYKFKKSIRLPFADFSTLERRQHFCEEELRLNRRLCPEVYLEVLPLRKDLYGKYHLGSGEGEVIDFALRMRRLPADRMLDLLLENNAVSAAEITALARRIVSFHAEAPRGAEVSVAGDPLKLRGFALANFEETLSEVGPERVLSGDLHAVLADRTRHDFERNLPLLRERARAGHLVDGHGDLHAGNICMSDPLAIYDCIEFNPAFRCGDTATEHAFLLMDLRFRGHANLATVYREAILTFTGDREMISVLPMLERYRAMVRAKVSVIAAGDEEVPAADRAAAAETARQYLRLAAVSAIEEEGPWWLIFCGLPAAGKSHLAEALTRASRGGWEVFSSDHLRKELAGVTSTEKLPLEFYDPEFSRRTYEEVRARATQATRANRVIILDANFRGRDERRLTLAAAKAAGARLAILRIETDESVIRQRLAHRAASATSVSDADRSVYESLKAAFEEPGADEADLLIPVSGDLPADAAVDKILAALAGVFGAA